MQTLVLVDYDNAKPNGREMSAADSYANLELIIQLLTKIAKSFCPNSGELIVRLYGGWIDERGQYTRLATWMLPSISQLRGRHNGYRVRFELALNVAAIEDYQLIGTYRRSSNPPGQKMVDTMIAVDLMHLTQSSDCPIILCSDDDDLVPSLLYAAHTKRPCALSRARPRGAALNDAALTKNKIEFFGSIRENS